MPVLGGHHLFYREERGLWGAGPGLAHSTKPGLAGLDSGAAEASTRGCPSVTFSEGNGASPEEIVLITVLYN